MTLTNRREVITGLLAMAGGARCRAFASGASFLPTAVAGIAIPRSRVTQAAAVLSRQSCPEMLFNHCMRTFLFGALHEQHHGRRYDAEAAFVAAALHDMGLLPAFESASKPFEVDSADLAEQFALQHSMSSRAARTVWDAAAMHDMRWAIVEKQNPTVQLVAAGAGADVMGPDEDMISPAATAEVVKAFPRLGFKIQFVELLTQHCRRKPVSQVGTWLEGYCRAAVPNGAFPNTGDAIASAPFSE
jgi:HD domain